MVLLVEAAELLYGYLPPDCSLKDLGQYRMKGMTPHEHLFQLLAPGLPASFPALATLDTIPNNLPVQLITFVGRETEIAEGSGLWIWEHGFREGDAGGRPGGWAARHAGQSSGFRSISGRDVGLGWARGVAADGQCSVARINMRTIKPAARAPSLPALPCPPH